MNDQIIINDLKNGITNTVVAKKYKIGLAKVKFLKNSHVGITSKLIRELIKYPDFKVYFENLYNNKDLTLIEMSSHLQKHPLFLRKTVNPQRISELRLFFDIPSRMKETVYKSESDRIKGYIIRNSKFTAKRRNIHFDLTYNDFEIPKYCPILNIKLTYLTESNGNDPSHSSLDRIDNSKGYVKGNVIIISRLANAMKNAANFEQLKLFSLNINKLINYYENQGALGSITDLFEFEPKLNLDS